MKIDKITYQKSFPIGPFLQEKIGIEVQIEPGDNEDTVFLIAKEQVERWHKENNPHLNETIDLGFGSQPLFSPAVPTISKDKEPEADTLTCIKLCETLEELQTYKTMASTPGNKTLYDAYCSKLKDLSSNSFTEGIE